MFSKIGLKIIASFFVVIVSAILVIGGLTFIEDAAQLERMLGERLAGMAGSGAVGIDADAHESIIASQFGEVLWPPDRAPAKGEKEIRIEGKRSFLALRSYLLRLKQLNDFKQEIYTLRPLEAGGGFEYVVMTNEKPFVGFVCDPAKEKNRKILTHLERVTASRKPHHSHFYEDAEGLWVSGFAPILDPGGAAVGVLVLDYNASEVYQVLKHRLRALVVVGLGATAVAFLIGIWLSGRISKPICQIGAHMNRLKEGDLAVRVDVRTGDELQEMGEIFNGMAEGLLAKQKLLLYVSKAAWESAHRRAQHGVDQHHGESKVVTLFFSDIKGFTTMSSRLSAQQVIEILNEYFDQMCQVIARHNGHIDKFIGDAIMAWFDGPGDHGATAAVHAAVEMQLALRHMPAHEALVVRMGIHTGEVVMGDLGSMRDRCDYTCIGDNVNRAQRLESTCTPGRVHLSEAAYGYLKEKVPAERRGPIRFKGLDEDVYTYEVDPEAVRGLIAASPGS